MGEVQEQRYVCKICSKSCVSGKSLGGHMRVHSALISSSKKSDKQKSEFGIPIDEQPDDQESSKNQSNSVIPGEDEKIESGDGDQSTSYGLRENPRKSWRVSDPKHGVVLDGRTSCKECSKVFPSLKALSGHMRSHSNKNKKLHKCKKCGRGFDSMRAMFGHMKTHSTKLKPRDDDNAGESVSDLDDFCPVRRKRSRMLYNSTSTSAVSEHDDVVDAAKCLMMLSRGEMGWIKFDFAPESFDDDDSVYFGANSSCRTNNSPVVDNDHEMEVDLDAAGDDSRCSESNDSETLKGFVKNECDDNFLNESKSKEHECPTCFKVFMSGQALGGHKRAHYNNGSSEIRTKQSTVTVKEEVGDLLDLNYPVAVDTGVKNEVGINLWWGEHDTLIAH